MFRKLGNRLAGLFYGWRMVGVSCAIRLLGGGLHAYGFTVFFLPITQELGLSRAATSLVFSLARAQGAIEGPVAGYCIDRYGPRPVIFVATLLAGIGYMLLAGVHSYSALLIVYMGIISLSYQAGFMDATMVVANSWFIRKRALAMSLTSGSIALGGTLVTPFLAYAVHTWGWRSAAMGAGVAFLYRWSAPVPAAAPLAGEYGLVAGWRAVAQSNRRKRINARGGSKFFSAANLALAPVLVARGRHHLTRSLLQLCPGPFRANPSLARFDREARRLFPGVYRSARHAGASPDRLARRSP